MLWVKSLHLIFMVTWFAGLFYLPRLFVYHAMANDVISIERFKIMERKLLFGIMTPGAVLTTLFGIWLLSYNLHYYLTQGWIHIKLTLIALLWIYHFICIKYWLDFKKDNNKHSHVFYRWFNEIPVIFLVLIVIVAIVRPTFQ